MEKLLLVYSSFSLWETELRSRQDTHFISCAHGQSHGRMNTFMWRYYTQELYSRNSQVPGTWSVLSSSSSSNLSVTQVFLGSPSFNITKHRHLLQSDHQKKNHQKMENFHEEAFCSTTGYVQKNIISHNPAHSGTLWGNWRKRKIHACTHTHRAKISNKEFVNPILSICTYHKNF